MSDLQLTLIPDERTEGELIVANLSALPANELLSGEPDREMLKSVARYGILQPIALIGKADGTLIVAAGRRRIKAARAAGFESIPAILFPEGYTPCEVISIVENIARKPNLKSDLEAVVRLLDRGASIEEIVQATGMPKQTIEKRLKLTRLIPELRQLFQTDKMSGSTAEAASSLTRTRQTEVWETYRSRPAEDGDTLTMADVTRVRKVSAVDATSALPDFLFSAPIPSSSETLSERPAVAVRSTDPIEGALTLIEESLELLGTEGGKAVSHLKAARTILKSRQAVAA